MVLKIAVYYYARLDVISTVMIGVWQLPHRKLLLFNSKCRHTHTPLHYHRQRIYESEQILSTHVL